MFYSSAIPSNQKFIKQKFIIDIFYVRTMYSIVFKVDLKM